jgi:NAD(P)-dependent dehydrogenase (short-subunit alcohol dehydrogenase family)
VSVAPTFVETELTASSFADPAFREDTLRAIPLGRLGQAAEVARAIAFAASDDAALITGSSLLLDGGYVAR